MSSGLVPPYGGLLVDLFEPADSVRDLARRAALLPSVRLSERARCDLELLATGAFSPLDRFMSRGDYERVLGEMRLENGVLFPIPVTLPIADDAVINEGGEITLRGPRSEILAIMTVEEVYEWDLRETLLRVLGTTDTKHPLAAEMSQWGRRNISGPIRVIDVAQPYDFREIRRKPAEVRALLEKAGHRNVVAFQTRNPMHRAHEELTKRAAAAVDGTLLLHPTVGMTKPGDVDHFTRVRCYKILAERYYPHDRVLLSLIPLAMRMAGPREAVWHAIIRRNFGANHFIVGRDHASPGSDSSGRPFYGPQDAQELLARHGHEIGVRIVPFEELVYVETEDRYEEVSKIRPGTTTLSLSGTEVREQYLARGRTLPAWFTRPEVAAVLAEAYPPRERQGFCVWFTGLSAAGKSTTAEILVNLLLEHGRQVTHLDGDVVRTHLSKGLGFSREDRDANILRIGFVAAEIVRQSGAAVCAAVSPYSLTRQRVRDMVGEDRFVEVFVDTPLAVCEARDPKGMYAQARRGLIRNFTGVSDPYEPPESPDLRLETTRSSAEKNARRIIDVLKQRGFIR